MMDKYGIDIQAISQTTPAIPGLSREDAAEMCRICNDDNYALCKAYPDRFVNICMIYSTRYGFCHEGARPFNQRTGLPWRNDLDEPGRERA